MAYTKYPEPTTDELAVEWVKHFYSADRAIRWGNIEHEHSLWLDDQTLLLGKIDADGMTEDGEPFFADWKTISAKNKNRMDEEKAEYRLDPQMLTYGVLCQNSGATSYYNPGSPEESGAEAGSRVTSPPARFMVRWAMKNSPPLFFYEWYRYTQREIEWWRSELIEIAWKIRDDRSGLIHAPGLTFSESPHFIPNLQNCFKYGKNYPCSFYGGCSKQEWDARPEGAIDRVSHLKAERDTVMAPYYQSLADKGLVVLDATRVDTWLTCNEKYRKQYIENIVEPPGAALQYGLDFHSQMANYYIELKRSQHG